ncbi:MAG: ABC transporter ATP-binding protein [Bacilli bacterium]|jgi:ABC-2 type transport system ATP-binding protein|nr:ABC transporter ATP-binding protein [Bacilli bacterium]
MRILTLNSVRKTYPSFVLDGVSFSLEAGHIVGFIGRNGAGKTTTLKCIYNLVSPDSGSIEYLGKEIRDTEAFAKSEIGLLFGGIEYYPNKTLRRMTSITSSFYPKWNRSLYESFVKDFGLDENKKIKELSSGMKVKYGLALALSHGAKALLLDEPTSGLDPVSRDELMDIFMKIVSDGEHTILFSTHVISDLEKSADDIVYIKEGKIIVDEPLSSFEKKYVMLTGDEELIRGHDMSKLGYVRVHGGKFEFVVPAGESAAIPGAASRQASLEEIMVFLERGEEKKNA